jgi:hypothetical protein
MATLAMEAPFVIASRMTEFWMTAASPTASSKREASQMVTEKLQAMGESAVAMNMAMVKVAMESTISVMTGVMRSAHNDADDVLSAALHPYARRVTANGKRLSR